MYGTSHSLSTMNSMDIIDGSGTIDPANLSNSGMYLIAFLATLASRLSFPIFVLNHKFSRATGFLTWWNESHLPAHSLLYLCIPSPSVLSN